MTLFKGQDCFSRLRRLRNDSKGQSGIEFMLVMLVVFFFLFFFLSLSIVLIISDYVEYATFMAARTYKSYASSPARQEEHAQLVFDAYFQKIEGIARNPDPLNFVATADDNEQTQGVLVNYDIDLFYFPPLFITDILPGSRIRLTAEAHLGRDPSFEECTGFFRNMAGQVFQIQNDALAEQMEDNGC